MGGRGSASTIGRGNSVDVTAGFRKLGINVFDLRGKFPLLDHSSSIGNLHFERIQSTKKESEHIKRETLKAAQEMQKEFGTLGDLKTMVFNDRKQDKMEKRVSENGYSDAYYNHETQSIHLNDAPLKQTSNETIYHEIAHSITRSFDKKYHDNHANSMSNNYSKEFDQAVSEYKKKYHTEPDTLGNSSFIRKFNRQFKKRHSMNFEDALLKRARSKTHYTAKELASPYKGTSRYGYLASHSAEPVAEGIADYMVNSSRARSESKSIVRELKSYLRGEWQ